MKNKGIEGLMEAGKGNDKYLPHVPKFILLKNTIFWSS